jgi:SAM-dependent methyltransferase
MREQVHGMWASVAAGWAEHADFTDARATIITERLLARTAPVAGERVLELACGPGGMGIAVAPLVAPGGEVVLTDVAPEMVEIARRRAAEAGLDGVRTAVRDIEAIDEPDASFDVVLCRDGLMFAVDPRRATREIARVLRPGGRAAVAVWGPRDENPWLGAALDAVGDHLGTTLPPPGVPGPFSLADAGQLASVLADGGLSGVAVEQVAVPFGPAPFDEWWGRTCTCAGPIAALFASLPEEAQSDIRERARAAVAEWTSDDTVELPGLSLVASGRR